MNESNTNTMVILHVALNSIAKDMKIPKSICHLINAIIDKELWPPNLKTQVLRPVFKNKGDGR